MLRCPAVAPRSSTRLHLALACGSLARLATRITGRAGDGVHARGTAICMIDPRAIERLSAGRRAVLVSGGNGKTTTTYLLARAMGGHVAHNGSGANMHSGVVTALADSAADVAVLEVDELHLPSIARSVDPEVIVLLNVVHDRPGPTSEVPRIVRTWPDALERSRALVIANAADPNVVATAPPGRSMWFDPGIQWRGDARDCPRCGAQIDWTPTAWSCRCGLAMPEVAYRLQDGAIAGPDGSHPIRLALPGTVNLGNAMVAALAAQALGVDIDVALGRMTDVTEIAGRYRRLDVGGRPGLLLLVKNPAGFPAVLDIVGDDPVIIGMNARPLDGLDMYAMPYASLAGRTVGATGEARIELARLLRDAGVEPIVDTDLERLAAAMPPGDLVLVANYTVFRAWRQLARW